jgi:hypothetical protein
VGHLDSGKAAAGSPSGRTVRRTAGTVRNGVAVREWFADEESAVSGGQDELRCSADEVDAGQ